MSLILCNVGVAQAPGKSAKPAEQVQQTLQLPDQCYSIDIICNMDWKCIIILLYDVLHILSTVCQFVAILFVVTQAAI